MPTADVVSVVDDLTIGSSSLRLVVHSTIGAKPCVLEICYRSVTTSTVVNGKLIGSILFMIARTIEYLHHMN